MNCLYCQKTIQGKSWLHLNNIVSIDEDENKSYQEKHICGYSCYCRLSESNNLPKNLWSHTINKEDYKDLISPVINTPNYRFRYLTENEIMNLNEKEKEIYLKEEQHHILINPLSYEIHNEIIEEDKYTSMIETMITDEEIIDDY